MYLKYLKLQTEPNLISDIKKEFANSSDVHEFKLSQPPITVPVCSWFHVCDDEKISSIRRIFDPRPSIQQK
ncbi:MAG: hypothetical protein WBX01_15035 [Nitrososphaeraceae archaeon]